MAPSRRRSNKPGTKSKLLAAPANSRGRCLRLSVTTILTLGGLAACAGSADRPATSTGDDGPDAAIESAASTPSSQTSDKHWWLDLSLDPAANPQAGLEWQSARFLTEADLVQHLDADQQAEIDAANLTTDLTADLNKNGRTERYRVGIFSTRQDDQGHFLAVYEDDRVIKVFPRDGAAQLSGLERRGDSILWHHCLDCDDIDEIGAGQGDITIR